MLEVGGATRAGGEYRFQPPCTFSDVLVVSDALMLAAGALDGGAAVRSSRVRVPVLVVCRLKSRSASRGWRCVSRREARKLGNYGGAPRPTTHCEHNEEVRAGGKRKRAECVTVAYERIAVSTASTRR
jgi:hypothetical protein